MELDVTGSMTPQALSIQTARIGSLQTGIYPFKGRILLARRPETLPSGNSFRQGCAK